MFKIMTIQKYNEREQLIKKLEKEIGEYEHLVKELHSKITLDARNIDVYEKRNKLLEEQLDKASKTIIDLQSQTKKGE